MSYDESPWEREDREIHEAFRAKDAEIAGLQDELKIAAAKTEVQAYDRMLEELAEKDYEIKRLKEQRDLYFKGSSDQALEITDLKVLIDEFAVWVRTFRSFLQNLNENVDLQDEAIKLLQSAREATRERI